MTKRNIDGSPMLMKPAEAAARTGLSASFLKTKARDGVIPCVRGGKGAILFSQANLDDAVRILSQPPVAPQPSNRLTSSRAKRRAA
jgi:hypothetical protein